MIDTHVHFWQPKRLRYPWLDGIAELNRPFLVDDFKEALGGTLLDGWVFVQAECEFAAGMDELDWILSLAREDDHFLGLVPWAPLHEGKRSRAYLEKLQAASPLVKGVRRLIQSESDPAFCLQPEFIAGVRELARFGFSFDICISHLQLANTTELVRQCPEVQFVLDHIAKPDIKNQEMDPWRSELREMASLPNVVCKLSGLATEADHANWTRDELKPYIDHVIDSFGFNRVMFGGDWPVATLATTYPRWVETVEWAIEGCSESESRALFHDNAVRIYRLQQAEQQTGV